VGRRAGEDRGKAPGSADEADEEGKGEVMDIDLVIEKIGGGVQRRAAAKIGCLPMTLNHWKRKRIIPHWWQDRIRDVAEKMGVKI
jgi:hypothetical protein